jgi:putative membrane protein
MVAALVWLVVRFAASDSTGRSGGRERPEDVLDRRFTAGEIDVDTYKAQRAVLIEARKNR